MAWLAEQTAAFRERIEFGTLDLSGPYRRVFEIMVPDATLVADPFHVTKLANTKLDECRRRVQNETLGHRGRKSDPLYRCRRLLTKAKERLDDKGHEKLTGLLRAGDPHGDVATCWEAKEAVRELYAHADADLALEWVTQLGARPPGQGLPDRGPLARTHADPLEAPDRRLAPGPRQQRTHRGGQQPDQAGEARGLRVHVVPELPDPLTALRRQAQLGPAGHGHTPLKSEEPEWLDSHDFPYWDICFMKDKAAVGADLYIEDSVSNIRALRAAGKKVIVFNTPQNRDPDLSEPRASSWDEVENHVLEEIEKWEETQPPDGSERIAGD